VKMALDFVSRSECDNPSFPSAAYAVTMGRDCETHPCAKSCHSGLSQHCHGEPYDVSE